VLRNNGGLACYEARTGKQLYETRVEGKGGYSASLVAADGRLYCTSEDGDVSVVKAGPAFELLATNAMGDRCLATPAISRGKILIRAEHALYGISESSTPGLLAGPEPSKGQRSVSATPAATVMRPGRKVQLGQAAPAGAAIAPFEPPTEPGSIDPALWAGRQMKGDKWEIADLDAKSVTKGVLQVAGSADVRRWQVIYKALQFTGDFELTAQYKGNCRIGLVCADGQRGFIGTQDTIAKRGELRIQRTGNKVEFTLNGQPATYTKALASEEMPFYFGLVLDNGMQGELSGIQIVKPVQP
jgi:hypothetical protein